jgi:AbrB family looped-hinge helix DNA binding protein
MAKVTSKLQVTIPKPIAEQFGIKPGVELDWIPAGDGIRVTLAARKTPEVDLKARLKQFDEASGRQRRREASMGRRKPTGDRGWKREDLYNVGRSR